MSSLTNHAIRVHENGGPEVVKFDETPIPHIKDNQVLIKVEYAGINFLEVYFRTGDYKCPQLPFTLGHEGAGEIIQIGSKVKKFSVGDKVAFLEGNAYSEYISLDETARVSKLPSGVSTKIAAASLLQALTALTFVEDSYPRKEGDVVLIHAAAGGAGGLLVQFFKLYGCTVIGTTSTPEKVKVAKSYGADYVINYKEDSIVEKVKEYTNGKGVDAVFDAVGKDTWEISLESLKNHGYILTYGNASGLIGKIDVNVLAPKELRLSRPTLFQFVETPERWEYFFNKLYNLISGDKIKITITKEFPLKDCSDALTELESGKTVGKLILKA